MGRSGGRHDTDGRQQLSGAVMKGDSAGNSEKLNPAHLKARPLQ